MQCPLVYGFTIKFKSYTVVVLTPYFSVRHHAETPRSSFYKSSISALFTTRDASFSFLHCYPKGIYSSFWHFHCIKSEKLEKKKNSSNSTLMSTQCERLAKWRGSRRQAFCAPNFTLKIFDCQKFSVFCCSDMLLSTCTYKCIPIC